MATHIPGNKIALVLKRSTRKIYNKAPAKEMAVTTRISALHNHARVFNDNPNKFKDNENRFPQILRNLCLDIEMRFR